MAPHQPPPPPGSPPPAPLPPPRPPPTPSTVDTLHAELDANAIQGALDISWNTTRIDSEDLDTTRNLSEMASTQTSLHAVEIGVQGTGSFTEAPGSVETPVPSSGNVLLPCMATEVTSAQFLAVDVERRRDLQPSFETPAASERIGDFDDRFRSRDTDENLHIAQMKHMTSQFLHAFAPTAAPLFSGEVMAAAVGSDGALPASDDLCNHSSLRLQSNYGDVHRSCRPVFVNVFSGWPLFRQSGLSYYMFGQGFACLDIDYACGPGHGGECSGADWLRRDNLMMWRQFFRHGPVEVAFFAPNSEPFSVAKCDAESAVGIGLRPVRSVKEPHGRSDIILSQTEHKVLQDSEKMIYSVTTELVWLYRRGCVVGLENPQPRQLELLRRDLVDESLIPCSFWHHPAMMLVLEYLADHFVVTDHHQCRWNAPSMKPTRILWACRNLSVQQLMVCVNDFDRTFCQCPGGRHMVIPGTHEAQAYTSAYSMQIASSLQRIWQLSATHTRSP